jgi:hypothetical protein
MGMSAEARRHRDAVDASAGSGDRVRRACRRLLLEAAVEEGYPVRLQQRVAIGRTTTRIVRPVELQPPGPGSDGEGFLVIRLADTRELIVDLDQVDSVSIAGGHLPAAEVRRGRWSLGDAVFSLRSGLGMIQAFRGEGDREAVIVRFDAHGVEALPLRDAEIRPLQEPSDAEG